MDETLSPHPPGDLWPPSRASWAPPTPYLEVQPAGCLKTSLLPLLCLCGPVQPGDPRDPC